VHERRIAYFRDPLGICRCRRALAIRFNRESLINVPYLDTIYCLLVLFLHIDISLSLFLSFSQENRKHEFRDSINSERIQLRETQIARRVTCSIERTVAFSAVINWKFGDSKFAEHMEFWQTAIWTRKCKTDEICTEICAHPRTLILSASDARK